MNDLKFTTAADYMQDMTSTEYYINESGLKIDAKTGNLYQPSKETEDAQCSPP